MCFLSNKDVLEVIPFSVSEIIHDLNLLECGALMGGILTLGSEDEYLVLAQFKQLGVFLLHHILLSHMYIIDYLY